MEDLRNGESPEQGGPRCDVCRFYAPLRDPARGVCQRFDLWPRSEGRGFNLFDRRLGELRGSELVVEGGHGCSAFEVAAAELQRRFLAAFAEGDDIAEDGHDGERHR